MDGGCDWSEMMNKSVSLLEIAKDLKLDYRGVDNKIDGLGFCNRKTSYKSILAFAVNEKYIEDVIDNKHIVCMVLTEELLEKYSEVRLERKISYIVSDKPERTFYTIHEYLYNNGILYDKYNFEPKIGKKCKIHESVVIEKGVMIGNNVVIGPNSVVRSGSVIDDNVIIGCNTTIGSEGFQLITDEDNIPMHITHAGKCHICSDVYIGDNTCVCNSLLEGETYVGKGAKIDNLVHIAHNLYVGEGAVITAHVIACGSSVIEAGAWIGPNSSILNRVTIGKNAKVGLGSVVTRDVLPNTLVYGSPAKAH